MSIHTFRLPSTYKQTRLFAQESLRGQDRLCNTIAVTPECSHDFIFTGIEGKSAGTAMKPASVRQMLTRLAKRTGIEGKFNPHAFRHRAAREVAQRRRSSNRQSAPWSQRHTGHRQILCVLVTNRVERSPRNGRLRQEQINALLAKSSGG